MKGRWSQPAGASVAHFYHERCWQGEYGIPWPECGSMPAAWSDVWKGLFWTETRNCRRCEAALERQAAKEELWKECQQ